MKILYHHRVASNDGQYVHIDAIVTELKKQGHEIIMVAPSVAENNDFGSDGGWVSKLRDKLPKFVSELLEFSYAFYAFFKLCKAILKHKPDAIYERYNLFLPSGIWAKKLFGLPFQLEVNSPLLKERKAYGGVALSFLAEWSEHYVWKNADRVLPVTQVLAGYLRNAGVNEENIYVIPNGADTDTFKPKDLNNRESRFTNKTVVGFVGFCREWHKLDEVMIMLANNPRNDVFFLLVGDGPVITDLKQLAKKLGFEERFEATGLVKREEMPYWLDQIDIALQSAVTPWASPLKMLEYMAKGLAIVAPDTPNIRELLTDRENALLFENNNFENMVNVLELLLADRELGAQISNNALNSVYENNLTWSENAMRITRFWSEHA